VVSGVRQHLGTVNIHFEILGPGVARVRESTQMNDGASARTGRGHGLGFEERTSDELCVLSGLQRRERHEVKQT